MNEKFLENQGDTLPKLFISQLLSAYSAKHSK